MTLSIFLRLPLEMVKVLAQDIPAGWFWRGRHVKLVDGTTITLPDTEDNRRYYPQHGNQQPGVGFPLVHLVGVMSLSIGAIMDMAMGPYQGKGTGEYCLFRELTSVFSPDDIVVGDRYYCSYFLLADLMAKGVDVLMDQYGPVKRIFVGAKPLARETTWWRGRNRRGLDPRLQIPRDKAREHIRKHGHDHKLGIN